MKLGSELMAELKALAAEDADAPAGIEDYTWITVPRYWESVKVPTADGREVMIVPRREDRHGGLAFRVGWNEEERVAALWIL
ncbi:MAG: hypothetical protein HY704_16535 [Gemmatimonadetes bacterium]|nr:hypothetical protein [Gemmatimonadota bacterium]